MSFFGRIAEVTGHLFISGASAVTTTEIIRHGITCVINCTVDVPNIKLPDVEVVKIAVDDVSSARLGIHFDRCADKIRQAADRGGRTLVHCMAGVSRSSSICLAYLMKYHRLTLKQAYYFLKAKRPVIRPNPGFFRQLIDYERKVHGKSTVSMIDSPIGMIPDLYKEDTRNMVWLRWMLMVMPTLNIEVVLIWRGSLMDHYCK